MNTTGKFHLLGPKDLDQIIEWDETYFPMPWSAKQWREMNLEHHLLMSWEEMGFALFGFMEGDDTAHLLKILIKPELRGKGPALNFWKEILNFLTSKKVKNIYLEVEASNERAIGFYQKLGFLTLRRVKGYYSNGSDALMMNLTL